MRASAAVLSATCLVLSLGACTDARTDEVRAVVSQFEDGLSGHPARACALLGPATVEELESASKNTCEKALPEEDVPAAGKVGSVSVQGRSAQVVLDHDTIFLSRFPQGWRITAAGCTRQSSDPEIPYDCSVKGR